MDETIRAAGRFATFLGRSPDTATVEDVRRLQIEQRDAGVPTPTMNSVMSALRFFFTHTIHQPDLARIRSVVTALAIALFFAAGAVSVFILIKWIATGRNLAAARPP